MKRWMMALLASAMLLGTTQAAFAATAQENKLDDATTVIRQFVDIPENAIPPALLREAYGIAVIPSVLKVGFVVGGRRGKGVLSVRTQDGSWSNPSFITLTGGSLGWQAGASSSDIILVFKTQRSVDKIANGQFNLGADATVAAGPVGRSVGASTDLGFDAEVYSYSRSRGLFAGVSIEGARLGIDQDANWLFYDEAGIDAYNILRSSDEAGLPEAGERFVYTLDRYMPAAENYRDNAPAGNPGGDVGSHNRSGDANASNRESDEYGGRGQATPYEDGGDGVTVQQGNYDAADNDGNGGARQRSSDGADGGSGYGSSGDGDY